MSPPPPDLRFSSLPTIYRPDEVAEYLCLSRAAVYAYVRAGRLEALPISGRIRISGDALRAFVAGQRVSKDGNDDE